MQSASTRYDFFLSYSRSDATAAETLRARLNEAGFNAFLDRDALPAGQPWQPWLEEHLTSCRALIVLVGSLGFGQWQHREIQIGMYWQASAAKTGRVFPIIPVLLPGLASDAVPAGTLLGLNTWVDLRGGLDDPDGVQQLVAGVQGRTIDAAAANLLAGLTPYRGLLPFREQDAGLFFGRRRFVEEMDKRLFVSLVTPGEGREDTRTRIDMPDDDAMRRVIPTSGSTSSCAAWATSRPK